ncbi:20050_t:CDS:2 [Rhizophagus irregularis]|nr:20050_t:CDS:2 [Rhizophagus irregularis]
MNLARIQIFIVDFNSAINGCEFLEFQEKELIRSPLNKIAFLRTTSLDLVLLKYMHRFFEWGFWENERPSFVRIKT